MYTHLYLHRNARICTIADRYW